MSPFQTIAANVVPSLEDATQLKSCTAEIEVSAVHEDPEFVDVQIFPPVSAATNFDPLEEEAIPFQALLLLPTVASVHEVPLLEEINMFPSFTAAASCVPSDEEVTAYQFLSEFKDTDQVLPESEDFHIFPEYTTATNFVPSEEEATPHQRFAAPVVVTSIQVAAVDQRSANNSKTEKTVFISNKLENMTKRYTLWKMTKE